MRLNRLSIAVGGGVKIVLPAQGASASSSSDISFSIFTRLGAGFLALPLAGFFLVFCLTSILAFVAAGRPRFLGVVVALWGLSDAAAVSVFSVCANFFLISLQVLDTDFGFLYLRSVAAFLKSTC